MTRYLRVLVLAGVACLARPAVALADAPSCASSETSPNLPPAGSAPLLRCVQFAFHTSQDANTEVGSLVDFQAYYNRLKAPITQRSQSKWAPYDEGAIQTDFWNLWRTEFLDNLWVEILDEPYDNGVMGKHVIYHIVERPRIKIVDYVPAAGNGKLQVEISKIESTLRDRNIEVRLDSFIDETIIRKVKGVIRELYAEKGFNSAKVTTTTTEMAGGSQLVHLTFEIDQGPEVTIRSIVFDGNQAFDDDRLRGQMKDTKQTSWASPLSGDGKYQESKYDDDAERVAEYYRMHGYARIQIGAPQVQTMEVSKDGKHEYIQLRIPVEEGTKYTIGKFDITGAEKLNADAVRAQFKIKEGDLYNIDKIRKGWDKVKEAYGQNGFFQVNWEPDILPRGIDPETGQPIGSDPPPPIIDINIHVNEGKQFTVNQISFTGNTTTHDAVIRRELRVFEGGIFNSEALKESIRRLNQLGYFKTLEGKEGEMDVTPTANADNKVDIKLKFEEQNRNQLTFGAGVSQFDGFYGQLSFQTQNFLGRGEAVGISLQRGSQAEQYQLSFSEPYLFDRPITVGASLFSRQFIFPLQYTQGSNGGNTELGLTVADYTRLFLGYSYEAIHVFDIDPSYLSPQTLAASPYLRDSLLLDHGGRRNVSKISPSLVFNTVNAPIFPSKGRRLTGGVDIAGLGGNVQYVQTSLESIWYVPLTRRTSLGLRAQSQYIRPYGSTTTLPIFEKLFGGGEYDIRGFDLRTVSPRDPATGVITGGNKTLVFNAEYYVNLFGQVRLVGFYDAGQVRDLGQPFSWREPITVFVTPQVPFLSDSFSVTNFLTAAGAIHSEVVGHTSAFKTSTGLEVRFFMPVINVPFRLIMAYNPQRLGVLNNNGVQTPKFTFRFAVGTQF